MTVDDLFAPCDNYERDPELPMTGDRLERSCVYCIHQYEPGQVCPTFQKRLQQAAGLIPHETEPREVSP